MKRMTTRLLQLLAACVWTGLFAGAAMAQNNAAGAAPSTAAVAADAKPTPPCPTRATDIPVRDLYGRWQATFDGSPATVGAVEFHLHPDYAGSVAGSITRGGDVAQLAGDIDNEGRLNLDESLNGVAISAGWAADLQAGSCGKAFKGVWRNVSDGSTRNVVLRRAAYWN